jgi:hypothetical protein
MRARAGRAQGLEPSGRTLRSRLPAYRLGFRLRHGRFERRAFGQPPDGPRSAIRVQEERVVTAAFDARCGNSFQPRGHALRRAVSRAVTKQ